MEYYESGGRLATYRPYVLMQERLIDRAISYFGGADSAYLRNAIGLTNIARELVSYGKDFIFLSDNEKDSIQNASVDMYIRNTEKYDASGYVYGSAQGLLWRLLDVTTGPMLTYHQEKEDYSWYSSATRAVALMEGIPRIDASGVRDILR